MTDNDSLNIRISECQVELEIAEKELSFLIQTSDVYDDEVSAQKCDHLLMKIDMLTGELESIINTIE